METNGMDDSPPKGLTQEEFDLLLSKLHTDRDLAGQEYVLLCEKLASYFHARNCLFAEDLVDETLNRVAKKIASGEAPRNIMAYCYGFARLVWLEYLKKPETSRGSLEDPPTVQLTGEDEIHQKEREDCLYKCLHKLPGDDARALIEYWSFEDRPNRDLRKELAEELGISSTALRIRVCRVKRKVGKCVKKCLGEKTKSLK
jgi:RNA polymerase sigma factor (sigma-70 family)